MNEEPEIPDAILAEREREKAKWAAHRTKMDYGKLVYVRVSPDERYLMMTDPKTGLGCDSLLSEARGWRDQVRAFVERLGERQ